jgi:hypothetical protein
MPETLHSSIVGLVGGLREGACADAEAAKKIASQAQVRYFMVLA